MTLLPDHTRIAASRKEKPRFRARLMESSWRILDRHTGEIMGKARYTVEIQARFAAKAMNRAYRMGLEEGARRFAEMGVEKVTPNA